MAALSAVHSVVHKSLNADSHKDGDGANYSNGKTPSQITVTTSLRTLSLLPFLQASRPISMKKESIQSRNRKLSAKARKKHSSFTSAADMLKPLEKMYGYGMAGMTNAAAMSSYYMPNTGAAAAAAASIPSLHNSASPSAVSAAASHQYAAAAGMHMMAASTLGGFGAAAAPSFGGMVSAREGEWRG